MDIYVTHGSWRLGILAAWSQHLLTSGWRPGITMWWGTTSKPSQILFPLHIKLQRPSWTLSSCPYLILITSKGPWLLKPTTFMCSLLFSSLWPNTWWEQLREETYLDSWFEMIPIHHDGGRLGGSVEKECAEAALHLSWPWHRDGAAREASLKYLSRPSLQSPTSYSEFPHSKGSIAPQQYHYLMTSVMHILHSKHNYRFQDHVSNIRIISCVCVCVCVFLCVCVCECSHVCTYVCGFEWAGTGYRRTLAILFFHFVLYPPRQSLSLNLELGLRPTSPKNPNLCLLLRLQVTCDLLDECWGPNSGPQQVLSSTKPSPQSPACELWENATNHSGSFM